MHTWQALPRAMGSMPTFPLLPAPFGCCMSPKSLVASPFSPTSRDVSRKLQRSPHISPYPCYPTIGDDPSQQIAIHNGGTWAQADLHATTWMGTDGRFRDADSLSHQPFLWRRMLAGDALWDADARRFGLICGGSHVTRATPQARGARLSAD